MSRWLCVSAPSPATQWKLGAILTLDLASLMTERDHDWIKGTGPDFKQCSRLLNFKGAIVRRACLSALQLFVIGGLLAIYTTVVPD